MSATSSPQRARAYAGLDGLVLGDAFGDGWFTRSDEPAEEQWAAREPRAQKETASAWQRPISSGGFSLKQARSTPI